MGNLSRRDFHAYMTSWLAGAAACELLAEDRDRLEARRPNAAWGASVGDVLPKSAVLWSRCDRPARMIVETSTTESFKDSRRFIGPDALVDSDFTAKLLLRDLPDGERIFYRVRFQDLADRKRVSVPVEGQFSVPTQKPRSVKFVWSGDTAGQGYGIDVARGGMTTYEAMRKLRPDFFVHSGDLCYSDNPFPAEMPLDDGSVWKNVQTEQTTKVAETLPEFRANLRYNLLDENVRRFYAEVPIFAQWDDHETTNNWYPSEQLLSDDRYTAKSASLLAARAKRAFFEYQPIRETPYHRQRIFRNFAYGPSLELFFIDLRSYRGANSKNDQSEPSPETAFLGRGQLRWLKKALKASTATWKVICSDMPLGLIVRDGGNFENGSNTNGPPLGREHDIAELLRFMKQHEIKNTVWLTADVHYAASHYYDPEQAVFQDFLPFWEFVSGPLHAGTFGPGQMDNTFGPQQKFCSLPKGMKPNRPPSEGLQFFGQVDIDEKTQALTVTHFNAAGKNLWSTELAPQH